MPSGEDDFPLITTTSLGKNGGQTVAIMEIRAGGLGGGDGWLG
jgi:hypothetical protein